jgi:hypothetical protein
MRDGLAHGALAAVALLAARTDALAQGCAMCRTALGSADDPLARGFYWSILFMMSTPYIVTGSVAAWLVYRHVTGVHPGDAATDQRGEIGEDRPDPVAS